MTTAERKEARPVPTERRAPAMPAQIPPSSGGVAAGWRAGLLTAALLCGRSWLEGHGFWLPMKAMAAFWLGPSALLGGGGTNLLGLLTHVGGAAALGGLFAAALGRSAGPRRALGWGLALGGGVWLAERWLLPGLDRTLWARVNLAPYWWLAVDLLFGACLARVPALRRRGARELEREETAGEAAKTFY